MLPVCESGVVNAELARSDHCGVFRLRVEKGDEPSEDESGEGNMS